MVFERSNGLYPQRVLPPGSMGEEWDYPLTPGTASVRLQYETADKRVTRLFNEVELQRDLPRSTSRYSLNPPPHYAVGYEREQRLREQALANRSNETSTGSTGSSYVHLHYAEMYSNMDSSGESDFEFPVPAAVKKATSASAAAKAVNAESDPNRETKKDVNTKPKDAEEEELPPTFRWVHIEIV